METNSLLSHFVDRMRRVDVSFERAYAQCIEYWKPESPPPTTLFSAFGRTCGKLLEMLPEPDKLGEIARLIEEMIKSDDRLIGECAATGFLEALYAETCREPNETHAVEQWLLPESRAHWDAWRKFGS